MFQGYVKLHRKLLDNTLWKSEPFTKGQAWVDLIMLANHKETLINIRGIMVPLKRGQVGYSELKLAARWHWSRGKVRRFLKVLKSGHQIEHQKNNVTSLIYLLNYELYQGNGTTDETPNGHQTDTKRYPNKNVKNVKNVKKNKRDASIPSSIYKEVIDYLNQKTGKNFRPKTDITQQYIRARWREGYRLPDFRKVIDNKCKNWLYDERMVQCLRPQTLFSTNFESYLNEIEARPQESNASWKISNKSDEWLKEHGIER